MKRKVKCINCGSAVVYKLDNRFLILDKLSGIEHEELWTFEDGSADDFIGDAHGELFDGA